MRSALPDPALIDAAVETLLGDGQERPRGTCVDCPRDGRGVAYPNLCARRKSPDHAARVDYAMLRNVATSMWRQGHEAASGAHDAAQRDREAVVSGVAACVRMEHRRGPDALRALFADGRERTNDEVASALGSNVGAVAQLLRRSAVVERVRRGAWRLRAVTQPGAALAPAVTDGGTMPGDRRRGEGA